MKRKTKIDRKKGKKERRKKRKARKEKRENGEMRINGRDVRSPRNLLITIMLLSQILAFISQWLQKRLEMWF